MNVDDRCGFSVENPFCFTSAEQEFAFIEALISPAGTRFIQGIKFTCKDSRGTLIDHFTGHYLDENGTEIDASFYANRYCSSVHVVMPPGWSLDIPGKTEKPSSSSITMTDRSYGYSAELREVKYEKEFDALYEKVAMKDMRDFLAALANGYNNGDNHFIWLFGLFDVKRKDPSSAYHKFKRAAAAGLPGAQLSLAKLLRQYDDLGMMGAMKNALAAKMGQYHKDNKEALEWIKKAVAQGYRPAEEVLETWYLERIIPGDNVQNAATLYLDRAEAGDAQAMFYLSEVYRGRMSYMSRVSGPQKFTEKDMKVAMWRQRSAEAGCIDAIRMMGRAYDLGWNVVADAQKSIEWYKRGADKGDVQSLRCLIQRLEDDGCGFSRFKIVDEKKDREKATTYLEYYRKAAQGGYDLAGFGLMYLIEQGCEISRTKEEESNWRSQQERERARLKKSF